MPIKEKVWDKNQFAMQTQQQTSQLTQAGAPPSTSPGQPAQAQPGFNTIDQLGLNPLTNARDLVQHPEKTAVKAGLAGAILTGGALLPAEAAAGGAAGGAGLGLGVFSKLPPTVQTLLLGTFLLQANSATEKIVNKALAPYGFTFDDMRISYVLKGYTEPFYDQNGNLTYADPTGSTIDDYLAGKGIVGVQAKEFKAQAEAQRRQNESLIQAAGQLKPQAGEDPLATAKRQVGEIQQQYDYNNKQVSPSGATQSQVDTQGRKMALASSGYNYDATGNPVIPAEQRVGVRTPIKPPTGTATTTPPLQNTNQQAALQMMQQSVQNQNTAPTGPTVPLTQDELDRIKKGQIRMVK
jgi:hypothetical protein